MVETSLFRDAIIFFDELGIYDVVLPFLLVFSVMYAILDKTRVLGTDKIGDEEHPKRNINAMIAFVVAFFVVASTKLVAIINQALANIVLVLLMAVMFLMLVGVFFPNSEEVDVGKGWRVFFIVVFLVVTIFIFLYAIPTADGSNWLISLWDWLESHWDTTAIASIIMLVVLILLMWGITSDGSSKKSKDED